MWGVSSYYYNYNKEATLGSSFPDIARLREKTSYLVKNKKT